MQFLKKYALLVLFAAFLVVFSVVDIFISNRTFSEMENRYLAQRPKFSWSDLFKNQYTLKYETYVNDQFVGRDGWITLKSISESALGKIENNGILYGDGDYLFEKYTSTDLDRISRNTAFINQFIAAYGQQAPITFALIPGSYEILADLMPKGIHNVDQREIAGQIEQDLTGQYSWLSLFPVMEEAVQVQRQENPDCRPGEEPPVYYRTDHHWTTLGAYNAYRAFVESRGLQAVDIENLAGIKTLVPGFYGSYYNKCKLFSARPDTIEWYHIPMVSITIDDKVMPTMHDEEKFQTHDKHAAFLWGNNGLTVIRSENNLNYQAGRTSRVLLIKDSYGNSFAPFLTYSYDEVYVVDLRSMPTKMSELMANTKFDDILIMYSFSNFASDTNIAKLTY